MYGVWNSDPDANRNKARIELIQFLLKKGMRRPTLNPNSWPSPPPCRPTPAAHLQAAQLFAQAQDYTGALHAIRERSCTLNPRIRAALAGAGEAAYHAGNYVTGAALSSGGHRIRIRRIANIRQLLVTTELILRTNPFRSHISDAERNRRIDARFRPGWAAAE